MTDIRALLVEDDDRLAALTAEYLERYGVAVVRVADGDAALREAARVAYDVILLDLMLPGCDGLDVCRQVRARADTPILMLTARDEEADRVLGLELGADDYLVKPDSARELLARIRAAVRRARGQAGPSDRLLTVGPLTLNPATRVATLAGRALDLTTYEFALLRALAERPGRVLSREQLLEIAKGNAEEAFDRSIDVRISRLRHKLGEDPRRPSMLRTIRGAGYALAVEEG